MELRPLLLILWGVTLSVAEDDEEYRNCPYAPVCANNGHTYRNMCHFRQEKQHQQNLDLVTDGICEFSYRMIKVFQDQMSNQYRTAQPMRKLRNRKWKLLRKAKAMRRMFENIFQGGPIHGKRIKTNGFGEPVVDSQVLAKYPTWGAHELTWGNIYIG